MQQKWILSLSVLSMAVGAQLFSLRAEAQVVCGTLAECRTLESQTQATVSEAQATLSEAQATLARIQARIRELGGSTGPSLGDILRDANGRVRRMTQDDAERACRELGARLPTVRELAAHSHSLGACAILSASEYVGFQDTGNCLKSDYHRVRVAGVSATEQADTFYFNGSGYRPPAGDLGNWRFWSSSVHPHDHYRFVYGLDGSDGGIFNVNPSLFNYVFAVLCVR